MTSFGTALKVPSSSARTSRCTATSPTSSLPLLAWPEERSIIILENRRTELRRRIAKLKPRSYARIVAEAELRALTLQALRLESERSDRP